MSLLELNSLTDRIGYIRHVLIRNRRSSYTLLKGANLRKHVPVVGMLRIRNEELILKDSLDHLANFVDGIVVYDDASTDNSIKIALQHPAVLAVIVNKHWIQSQRAWEEAANRRLLVKHSRKYRPKWFFYSDADERFEGDIHGYLLNRCDSTINGIRISLFDAYITSDDKNSYKKGQNLYNFRKYFGKERRDILMIWRNKKGVNYWRPDTREPQGVLGEIETRFFCQHYGKSLSIQHWEDTCNYYIDNFPTYSAKWRARKGKAIHKESDFGTKLYTWEDVKKKGTKLS